MTALDRRPEEPAYLAEERAVSNWRSEAVEDLEPMPLSGAAVLLGVGRPVVTRCVKLNNYWCIKRARWAGEIGSDDEGHVGFATAERGTDAAVALLRRYYLGYGRRSALDIVRRWAPAECRMVASTAGTPAAGSAAALLPTLAIRGIAGTLRARWLSSRRAPALAARSIRAQPKPAAAHPKSAAPPIGSAGSAPAPSQPVLAAGTPAGPEGADAARLRRPSAPIGAAARPTPGPATPPLGKAGPAVGQAAPTRRPAGSATAAATTQRKPAPRRTAAGSPATRVSVIPLRPLPTFRVPDIAAGMGERRPAAVVSLLAPRPVAAPSWPKVAAMPAAARAAAPRAGAVAVRPTPAIPRGSAAFRPTVTAAVAPARPAASASATTLPATARSSASALSRPTLVAGPALAAQSASVAPAPPVPPPPRPILSCGDEERIRNYAGRIVDGLDLGPSDDLELFEPNGMPRPNLSRVLLSMSAVELGHLRAGIDLIAEAVERATVKAAEAAALEGDRDFTP
jgi:hypothetical protein